MPVYTVDLQDTLDFVRVLERYYRRKNNFSVVTEVVRYFNIVSLKEFVGRHKITITSRPYAKFGQLKVLKFTMEMDDDTATHLLINVTFNNTRSLTVFAPVIYYMFPAIQRIGRMIIYKKKHISQEHASSIKNTMYLVHRSNYRDSPLDHPGGHIEYIETSETGELLSGVTYMKYVITSVMNKVDSDFDNRLQFRDRCVKDRYVKDQFDSHLTQALLNPSTISWIYAGTCREVHEESGLRINTCLHTPVLFKLGSKTHYFCCAVPSDTFESGPITKFRGEIYIEPEHKRSENASTLTTLLKPNISSSTNRFAVLSDCSSDDMSDDKSDDVNNNTQDLSKERLSELDSESNETHQSKSRKSTKTNSHLNEFWSKVYNKKTHHAWISAKELITYWDSTYLSHIEKVVAIAEEP